jgi:hypothetical protein
MVVAAAAPRSTYHIACSALLSQGSLQFAIYSYKR